MTKRQYVSEVRTAAVTQKRERVIEAAQRLLREDGIGGFSLDSVAKAAGITRLTVYNQFGSRRGLLEAAFDEIAQRGGLARLSVAIANPNARKGIEQLVDIFCRFWDSDPALASLHDAVGIDDEFAQALVERNERRRTNLTTLLDRVLEGHHGNKAHREAIDLMFGLTSCAMYQHLRRGRTSRAVADIIKSACNDAIDRLLRSS
ncbi:MULTISPECIES: TetR/AcrR family transcriptional regulator [unclassified Mesorhizobium]|uniref:TetR/AcrR family transcriptional regulator n=1 Tax=unclassified Mesorhizobium TaxID=325217 RepID=UPI00112AC14E|nr:MULTISPECIES: TetR/AcrR family transcriptional regulator [unclassified Mesorhizobium]MBZ9739645.1 TetR/AcrR family transcriptional regulator [Mesorhizobium sp. CO1-1-4]MBZ9805091.1 TetR/AcrR family transcriptional regulator [Mesorhizobium sp. ES1-6]TPL83572.1 TetR/AcrR family transcriptional regulator [Mesorhizobium sp. B2-3-12]